MKEEILKKIRPGAKIRVLERIKEGDKERQGVFEGIVISRKHGKEDGATFAVRATLSEVGVEKIYPINSPLIAGVKVLSSPKKVHKSKLYYIRRLSRKEIKEKLKNR